MLKPTLTTASSGRSSAASERGPAREAIAITGIGCRLPGSANDPAAFWSLLMEGRSAIQEVPHDRWNLERYYHPDPAVAGAMATRWGGFVDDLKGFDARFWGISPREAARMDPQQRWLLEVAWEAIEDAGLAPQRLRGHPIGVFVGISGNDYAWLQLRESRDIDAYTNSGNTASIAANRISYLLDLRGPSVAVDTACSSALVAVWLACENLWAGRCSAALAGGVNALISPQPTIGFSKASMMSRDGRCFAFDARANGYVRAEGAGVVVLKPLSVALADGDRVYATIRAATVNQDGHTSSMTVPGLEAQAEMLRTAYDAAGIAPSRVAYVEAHGTGTPVGDPIEAGALGRVLGSGRSPAAPCLIGSVKTNIGHLESAAGIAGLVKAALVLHHRTIPPSRNFERPNPQIPFRDLGLEVVTQARPLAVGDHEPPVVGVNSFGFGGTNAHVVLQGVRAAERVVPDLEPADHPYLLPISARDDTALREYVRRYRQGLADERTPVAEFCAAAGATKEHHDLRVVILGRTREEMRARAHAFCREPKGVPGVIAGRVTSASSPVFVFTGQGVQWWGMGRRLLQSEPVVRRVVNEVDACLRALAGWSLVDELARAEADSRIDQTNVAQPAIFALQVALAELWMHWGVKPVAVIGHSVGEVAAACCAGVYSLEDATRIIFHRSRLQHRTRGTGRMLAAAISENRARELLAGADVEIAAVNGPRLVTLSGDAQALESLETRLQAEDAFTRWLRIEYPFHSRQMEPLREELLKVLSDLAPHEARVPFVSTVTGRGVSGESLDARYWWRNVRDPVLFAPAVGECIRQGWDTYLELGAHPALEGPIKECLAEAKRDGAVFHSLRRDADDADEMVTSLAALHVRGVEIDWGHVNQASGAFVDLPRYPWNREPFWMESPGTAEVRLATPGHPLLGSRQPSAVPEWRRELDLVRLGYLKDHRIWDSVVFPAAGFAEMACAAARALFPDQPNAVEMLHIKSALFVPEGTTPTLQTVYDLDDRRFSIYSCRASGEPWQLHAEGTTVRVPYPEVGPIDPDALKDRLGPPLTRDDYARECASRGYQFGPAFQQVQTLRHADGEALAEIEVPDALATAGDGYCLHPAVLDACFHVFMGFAMQPGTDRANAALFLPHSIERLQLIRPLTSSRLWAHGRRTHADEDSLVSDIDVYDATGAPIALVRGLRLERFRNDAADELDQHYYQWHWAPRRLRGSGGGARAALGSPAEIVRSMTEARPAIARRFAVHDYHHRFLPALKGAVDTLIRAALVKLGWRWAAGDRVDFARIVRELDIVPEHHRATRGLLRALEKNGWIGAVTGDAWAVLRDLGAPDAVKALDDLEAAEPMAAPEMTLLRTTGLHLAEVLSGELDAMALLFPEGSPTLLEQFYTEGVGYPAHHELMQAAVAAVVAGLPAERALRVLEVGAGTGGLTRVMLRVLTAERTEYWFTDIGSAFIAAARARFADATFVEYRSFDLDKSPAEQGIPERYFDLVVGTDVLHATENVRRTLERLRSCLAPGGMLMAMEVVTDELARDNVAFALLKGWWRLTDTDLRPDGPLLGCSAWQEVLAESGFENVATLACTTEHAPEHAVLVGFATDAVDEHSAAADAPPQSRRYVIFADRAGVADALAARLSREGYDTTIVHAPPDSAHAGNPAAANVGARSAADIRGLFADDESTTALKGVVHCWSLDRPPAAELDVGRLRAAQDSGVMSALQVVHAVAEAAVPVWFVTRNVHCVVEEDRGEGLASAPLVGLVRVANNEHQCRFRTIDLDACAPDIAARHVGDEITLPPDREFEVSYRAGRRFALRLGPLRPEELPRRHYEARQPDGTVTPFRLEIQRPGVLQDLALRETQRTTPGPNQAEVRVRAAGINFRDLMKALGSYPGRDVDLLWLGDDFAGVVERVGEGVTHVRAGDEVVGMAPYAFRAYAVTDARFVFRKPASMSFAEAATLPTVFLTAHYGLLHLARAQPGERVLIHAAAGGVGQAAMQIARERSLEIFATAGTPEKRELLRRMGAHHVASSRTVEFADEIRALTRGAGVDIVLNSLAGEFIEKSLGVLAPFGRFLEIGKVDIYRNARIGLQPFRNNISYFAIDLAQHLRERPSFIAELFEELAQRFADGRYVPLPFTAFPITEAAEAFRFMAHGQHVGKNVLTFDRDRIPIAFDSDDAHRFRAHATYVVTGGAGGFGLEVAKWLARHGARHLVLVSRSGPRDEVACRAIDQLRAAGVTVRDARADVTRGDEVERVIRDVHESLPPLAGVFHAAMVIDDDFLLALDEARVQQVLEPKMAGAWNLHAATRDLPLEHFVCFSSLSTVIAMPKQGSYNAGNFFLDALAHHRRAHGLPSLTVNLGALLGAGFVERNQRTGEALAKMGFGSFRVEEALRVLGRLMFLDAPEVIAGRVNWEAVLKLSPLVAASNTYAAVAQPKHDGAARGSLVARLRSAGAERLSMLEGFIAAQVAAVCGLPDAGIERSTPLADFGIDSLMSLELTTRVERELGLRIPMSDVLSAPTVKGLAATALRLLQPTLADGEAIPSESPAVAPEPVGSAPAAQPDHDPSASSRHVVPLRTKGDAVPLFAFHPVGGGVGIYAGLASHLPGDVPVYGIESRLITANEPEYEDLDAMVDAYVAAVRSVHPGPYRLFGFSLGGYLAARVAEALEAAAAPVALVGVMDWDARQATTLAAQREGLTKLTTAAYRFVQEQTGIVRAVPEPELRGELARLVERVTTEPTTGGNVFFEWLVDRGLATSAEGEALAAQHMRRIERHCRLLTSPLRLPRFEAPLCVWRASRGFGSDLASWNHSVRNGREFVIEGDHHALLRPAALRIVARELSAALHDMAQDSVGTEAPWRRALRA